MHNVCNSPFSSTINLFINGEASLEPPPLSPAALSPAGTLRRVAGACLSSRERSSSFSCWAVSSSWVWTVAATSLFKVFLLMALMFRSSRKTSCLCGLATLRRHTTGRWSEESARATKQERTSCSLSLYSTQSMMCPQRWVGFRTP